VTARRPLALALFGAVIRELLPLLRKLADALDPAGNVGQAWAPRVVVPDLVPAAWVELEGDR